MTKALTITTIVTVFTLPATAPFVIAALGGLAIFAISSLLLGGTL